MLGVGDMASPLRMTTAAMSVMRDARARVGDVMTMAATVARMPVGIGMVTVAPRHATKNEPENAAELGLSGLWFKQGGRRGDQSQHKRPS